MRKGRLGLGIAFGLLFASPSLAAECDPCGEWSLGAHALYLAPVACPYTYASVITTSSSPDLQLLEGAAQRVSCGADWGFRVFGGYLGDCTFARVGYQWIDVTNTNRVVSEDSVVTIAGASVITRGTVAARTSFEYQNADVRLGRYLVRSCCLGSYVYGDVRWVDLSYKRSLVAFDSQIESTQTLREASRLKGGALGVGLGVRADVGCSLGGFVEGGLLGVIGERSIGDVQFFSDQPVGTDIAVRESYPSETCVLPEFEFRIGVDYTFVCGCWTLIGELGYELDYFLKGVGFPDLTGATITTTEDFYTVVCEDIGFSGLFFGLRVLF